MIPKVTNISKEEVDFYLFDLATKFTKINPEEYVLSYSGGKDSHLLYWFIKEYLHEDRIKIVGVNTRMEHPQISRRIIGNCDDVLLPEYKPHEVMQKYGTPCFGKSHDEMIRRYQSGSRAVSTMAYIEGTKNEGKSWYKLPKKAKELVLNDELHKVSSKCCYYLKKKPFENYLKENNKKSIIGVRGQESILRASNYKSCFTKEGKFTPLWDLTEDMENAIYLYYNIDIPPIYEVLDRTGCMGCPYGKSVEKDLQLLSDNQYNYVLKLFKKSYDVRGINYERRNKR